MYTAYLVAAAKALLSTKCNLTTSRRISTYQPISTFTWIDGIKAYLPFEENANSE